MAQPLTNPAPSLEALFRALDFDRPLDVERAEDSLLYVPNLHSSSGINPVDELRGNIEMAERPGAWLFTGHRGVGKSTELRRMAHGLREKGHLVVVADMGEYLNLAEPVSTELLLLTMVAALAEGADHYLGGERLSLSYGQRLLAWLKNSEVELTGIDAQLSLGETKFSFKTLLKQSPDFRQKAAKSVSATVGKLFVQAKQFVEQVAKEVAVHAHYGAGSKVVLVLDSLERLRVTGTDAAACYDAIQRTFDTNGEFLKLEHIHVVYSVPPYLPFLSSRIGSYFGVEICTLPHVKVFATPQDFDTVQVVQPDPEGLALMVQSVVNRMPTVEKLIPTALLTRLALASSGSMRDFFRLVRSVTSKARVSDAALPLANDTLVVMAEQVLRNEMPLAEDDKAWLRLVRKTHGDGLPSVKNLHQLARLFDSGLILNYRNGRDWCEVHYLLHDALK
jgi:energy-coupling factor transporter ATP-binding protein EcfA2